MKIFIDPGVLGTGLAHFTDEGKFLNWSVYKSKKGTWEERCKFIVDTFRNKLRLFTGARHYEDLPMPRLYCERPTFMESGRGHTSARRGDLVKLCLIAGGLYGVGISALCKWEWIDIAKWKGQLSKENVALRIKNILGKTFPDHATDAVGLGLYHFGRF